MQRPAAVVEGDAVNRFAERVRRQKARSADVLGELARKQRVVVLRDQEKLIGPAVSDHADGIVGRVPAVRVP